MTDQTTPPRRPWLRFSLRSLMVAVAVLAVMLGVLARWRDAKQREARAADLLLNRGGSVGCVDGRPTNQRGQLVWVLAKVLPDECLRTVIWVDVPPKFVNQDLALFADLPYVKTLHLDRASGVTPAGLAHLRGLSHVEVLSLDDTPVGDTGLAHLHRLNNVKELWLSKANVGEGSIPWIARNHRLTHLDLDGAQIGDESLPALAGLANLEVLALHDTLVTSRGMAELRCMPRLAHLYLRGTRVDDEGLLELESMSTLQSLDLRRTATTAEGRARFKLAQRQCRLEED